MLIQGPCRNCISHQSTANDGVTFLAEHCLDLRGTPLHWAARVGSAPLVQVLVELGADVNAPWQCPKKPDGAATVAEMYQVTALDVAVCYHFADVLKALYLAWASISASRAARTVAHSVLHCIGLPVPPFARSIAHGGSMKSALRKTITMLVNVFLIDPNVTGKEGRDPLMIALSHHDYEPYIVEELLDAGCIPKRRNAYTGADALSIAAQHAFIRPGNTKVLALLTQRSKEVDSKDCAE